MYAKWFFLLSRAKRRQLMLMWHKEVGLRDVRCKGDLTTCTRATPVQPRHHQAS